MISLESLQQTAIKPPVVVVFGEGGAGKSTLAAGAPGAVVLAVEDGLGILDVPHWPITSFADAMQALEVLYDGKHSFRTVVIDSVDALEPMVWAETCRRSRWTSLEQPDFGKGYVAADAVWREYLEGVFALRNDRGMTIVQIAHDHVVTFKSPDTEPYNRHEIKLHKRAAALIQESADIVGFLNFRVSVLSTEVAPKRKIARGVGGGQRVLNLEARPAFIAKNRYGMPPSIDLPTTSDPVKLWQAFAKNLPVMPLTGLKAA